MLDGVYFPYTILPPLALPAWIPCLLIQVPLVVAHTVTRVSMVVDHTAVVWPDSDTQISESIAVRRCAEALGLVCATCTTRWASASIMLTTILPLSLAL